MIHAKLTIHICVILVRLIDMSKCLLERRVLTIENMVLLSESNRSPITNDQYGLSVPFRVLKLKIEDEDLSISTISIISHYSLPYLLSLSHHCLSLPVPEFSVHHLSMSIVVFLPPLTAILSFLIFLPRSLYTSIPTVCRQLVSSSERHSHVYAYLYIALPSSPFT